MASSPESGNRRALQPLNQQLPSTARWATSLPDEVQPLALMQSLPRIANAIAHLWHDDTALRAYLDDLLVDQRGGRRGFSPEIQNELLILREYCEGRFPGHRPRCSVRVLRGRREFVAATRPLRGRPCPFPLLAPQARRKSGWFSRATTSAPSSRPTCGSRSSVWASRPTGRCDPVLTPGRHSMQILPYLFFDGRCEEAVEFYKQALGAEVQMLMRYKDSPDPPPPGMVPPGSESKVMHVSMRIGDTVVMASDDTGSKDLSFRGFSLSITAPSTADADRVFAALAEGGKVQMPLGKTFWSPRFGMVTDRFGVGWMVSVPS